jgi:hypothetical protein
MSVVIFGNGRCGTNITLEILRGSSILHASEEIEMKNFFTRKINYPKNLLTKSDVNYCETKNVQEAINKNPDLKIIWMIRDPRDMCLSKIYRGQPGHDVSSLADDATIHGCLKDMNKMFSMYKDLTPSPQIKLVKMENIITDIIKTTVEICQWLDIPFEDNMLNFQSRIRNQFKKARYKGLDKSQISLWKNWNHIYDGWFKDKEEDVIKVFNAISPITKYFKYEY